MSKERLVDLLLQSDKEHETLYCFKERPRKKQAAEIVADYILSDGWIRPPCKVGDKVYEIVHGEILETEAVGFLVCQDGAILIITRNSFPLSREVGWCVFLTREEAEAKLKEMKHT